METKMKSKKVKDSDNIYMYVGRHQMFEEKNRDTDISYLHDSKCTEVFLPMTLQLAIYSQMNISWQKFCF